MDFILCLVRVKRNRGNASDLKTKALLGVTLMLSWLPRERSDEASGLSIYYVAKNRHCVRSKSEFIFEVGRPQSFLNDCRKS